MARVFLLCLFLQKKKDSNVLIFISRDFFIRHLFFFSFALFCASLVFSWRNSLNTVFSLFLHFIPVLFSNEFVIWDI